MDRGRGKHYSRPWTSSTPIGADSNVHVERLALSALPPAPANLSKHSSYSLFFAQCVQLNRNNITQPFDWAIPRGRGLLVGNPSLCRQRFLQNNHARRSDLVIRFASLYRARWPVQRRTRRDADADIGAVSMLIDGVDWRGTAEAMAAGCSGIIA